MLIYLLKPKLFVRKLAIILTVSTYAFIMTACGGTSASKLEGPEDAIAVFKQRCMQCHGTELQGMMGPESNLQKIGAQLTKEQIISVIHNGGERMPAINGISDEEVDKVADWLSTLK